jgi:hypothetical protein
LIPVANAPETPRCGELRNPAGGAILRHPHRLPQERRMPRDFEDYCWKDVIDPETLQIYQAYRRKIFVGDNPAVLAIDLYNKAYLGGNRPVKEVDREFSGTCGENAMPAAMPTTSTTSRRSLRRCRASS